MLCSNQVLFMKIKKSWIWLIITKLVSNIWPSYYTELQIDSKSASEESQVCIAISGLYISLSGLSWCYLKVTGPLWKKILIEENLFYDNILKITILLKKFWFSKYYHRIKFFLSTSLSTVVWSPLDNIMKYQSSWCRELQWLYRSVILQVHF